MIQSQNQQVLRSPSNVRGGGPTGRGRVSYSQAVLHTPQSLRDRGCVIMHNMIFLVPYRAEIYQILSNQTNNNLL